MIDLFWSKAVERNALNVALAVSAIQSLNTVSFNGYLLISIGSGSDGIATRIPKHGICGLGCSQNSDNLRRSEKRIASAFRRIGFV